MNNFDKGYWAGSFVTGVSAIIIVLIILKCNTYEFQQEAIEAGAAYYDSKTDEFKWGKP